MSLDLGTLVATIGLDVSALTPAARTATQQLGQVEQAAAAVGGNLSIDKAIAGLARLGQEGRRAQDLLDGPASQLEHLAQATGQSVDDLRTDLQRMVTDAQKAGIEIGQVGEQAESSGSKLQQLATKVGGLFSSVSPALGDSIEGLGDKAKLAGAAMGAAVGLGLLGAVNAEPAKKKLVAQLALTPEEQNRIGASAENLFNGNYGEDLGSVNDAIKSLVQNIDGLRDASTEDLQSIAGQAISLGQTFDQDIGGVAIAVGQMLKTGMAGNAQEALDILTAGFQAGNDKAEDLLDTMNEYGTQFRKAGIDGKTAMGLIQQGLQGGARDADLVADAIKEMSIRLQDGSALEGLNELGLNGNEIIAQFREGGPQAAEALDTVIDKIRDSNAVTQDLAAVQKVAGTQVEDLGAAFNSLDLSAAAEQFGDVTGAAQEVDTAMGSTVAGGLESLKRRGISALTDLGEVVLPILADVVGAAGFLATGLSDLAGWFGQLPGPIKTVALALGGLALAKATGLVSALATGLVRAQSQMALMGATAGGAVGKLKSFGTAALGAVGGPGGLLLVGAITAVTLGISAFSSSSEEAKAAAEETRAKMEDLAGTLDKVTGAFTGASTAKLADQLAGSDEALRAAGTSAGEMADAITRAATDGGAALGQIRTDLFNNLNLGPLLDDLIENGSAIQQAMGSAGVSVQDFGTAIARGGPELEAFKQGLIGAGASSVDVENTVGLLTGRLEKNSPEWKAVAEAVGIAGGAVQSTTDSFRRLTDAAAAKIGFDPTKLNEGLTVAAQRGIDARTALEGMGITGTQADSVLNILGDTAATTATALEGTAKATNETSEATDRQAAAAAGAATQQAQANQAYEDAQAAAEAAGEALSTFEQASQDSADAQAELADQAGRVSDALDRQSGRAISLEEANAKASEAGDKLAETFKQGEEGALRLSDAMIQSDGSINTSTETGRTFREGVYDTRDAMVDQATAAFNAAGGYSNLTAATAAAEAASQTTYDQFLQTAIGAGLGETAAKNLAKEYGLLPRDVVTAIRADDQSTAKAQAARQAALDFAQGQYEATLRIGQGNIDAQIASAKAKLASLGQVSTSRFGPQQTDLGADRAVGGAIFGPGTGTSDDVPIMASNGEHMMTAAEVAKAGGHGAIYRLRAAIMSGNMPKFRAGGGIGVNLAGLSGIGSRSLGENEGLVVGALGDLMDAVRDLVAAEKDATDSAREARSDWLSSIDQFRKTRAEGEGDVKGARKDRDKDVRDATIDRDKTKREGTADVSKTRTDEAEKVTAAEKKLAAARALAQKTGEDRVKRNKAITDAEAALEKTKAARDKANSAARTKAAQENAKAEGTLSRARSQGNEAVRRATAEANKNNTAAEKKVAAERKQYQAAERARKAAEARASEAEADLRRTAKARQVLTALGRAADGATKNLQDARSKLDDLKDSRQGLISSIASTLSGYNGGILGNSEQRRTPQDVLRGLNFQADKVEDFGGDLATLKKKGLSAALLQQIAESGVDGGAATADALAKATPAMLRQINAASARTNTAAVAAGTTVGDAVFQKQIEAQTVQYRQMNRQLQELRSDQKKLAGAIGDEFGKYIGVVRSDELAVIVEKGKSDLRRRGVKV